MALTDFLRDVGNDSALLLGGLRSTLLLATTISITGFVGGVLVFFCTLTSNRIGRYWVESYISFFIGTPLLVLLFLMYYGLPQWGVRLSPLWVSIIGFTLNVAAYNARYLTTAYRGLDTGELEAARAQGFTSWQVFTLITLPQVLRLSIPGLTNQVILNLKDSSIAFLIQYTEFFAQIQELSARNFKFFQAYLFAGIVYLGLVSVIVLIARHLEAKCMIPGVRG